MNHNWKTYLHFNSQEKVSTSSIIGIFNTRKNRERNTKDLPNRQMDFRLLCKED